MDLHRFTRDLSFFGISHFSSPGDTFFFFVNRSESQQFEGLKFPFQFLESSTSNNASRMTCGSHRLRSPVFLQFPGTCATPGLAYRAE